MTDTLNERAQRLLKLLIERHIRDGQPVGSRTLSRDGLDLSPATIRNVMADLEELGLVVSPHTSAGRIPTAKGYRLFVDTLLTVKRLDQPEVEALRQKLSGVADKQVLMQHASQTLSSLTSMAGIVMLPRFTKPSVTLRHLEFLPLSNRRVLTILVFNEDEVQNRIIQVPRDYSAAELTSLGNYLNRHLSGKSLDQVRETLISEMEEARAAMDKLMTDALVMAQQSLAETSEKPQADFILAGETNLMGYSEIAQVEKLRALFEAFNAKRDILQLLDQSLHSQGVQIFIGDESGYGPLGDCSVVTAPYRIGEQTVGVLGVIGPTRMAYDRVIPVVDITARLLGHVLNQS